jgi:hypothetical protein
MTGGRFVKGQSGNPSGRPKARRPHVSAFDIIFDKRLTSVENGVERELTIDEALQIQTYQAALKGSRMAVRHVLKMIEQREAAMQAKAPKPAPKPLKALISYSSDSANDAMVLLDILCRNPDYGDGRGPRPLLVQTWAAQAAFSRPGRRSEKADRNDLNLFVRDFAKVRDPRGGR